MSNVTTPDRPVTLTAQTVADLADYLGRADAVLDLPHTPDRIRERHSILTEMAGYLRHALGLVR